ncbi:peptidoglycan-binding domain-containing protein [Streptomyces roseicoloratus]|uniref:Peptidoglycan-binding domain-containing protein n=1 Tax=Streptomyces roseicoloratus TaxID=2508722 RepID=A0ABY9RYK9_9ACTN|nr:peptidoglycan-binding domain-containing protein [Streptomyces roseicoloratus]WMX47277.1 peptidoglycan-binding domain-containing protein [Streptomyces roseicoloratus]
MSGHVCLECGVHRPGCACERAQAQAAEQAAAEDFHPLRIRPYVTLSATEDEAGTPAATEAQGAAYENPYGGYEPGRADDRPGTAPAGHPADFRAGNPADFRTGHPDGVPGGIPGGLPIGIPGGVPGDFPGGFPGDHPNATTTAAHPNGFPGEPPNGFPAGHPDDDGPALTLAYAPEGRGAVRRRGRGAVIAGVVAAAVVSTAALAAALIAGDDGTDDLAGVPEVTTSASENVAVSEAPTSTPSSSASASADPSPTSASPSPSASASASPSPTAARTRSTDPSAPPTRTAPAAPARPSVTTAPSYGPSEPPTLSLGSSGEEVSELQRRLWELGLYDGPVNGSYGRKVERAVERYQSYMYIEEDPRGVYGPHTREALEAVTEG